MTLLLAQLWWLMPIFILMMYLAVGFIICKLMIRTEHIRNVVDFWVWMLLWLPLGIFGLLITIGRALLELPKRFAENQLNKH